jgi:uncharacterized protein Yka (UPF0111/DUF47 family)
LWHAELLKESCKKFIIHTPNYPEAEEILPLINKLDDLADDFEYHLQRLSLRPDANNQSRARLSIEDVVEQASTIKRTLEYLYS